MTTTTLKATIVALGLLAFGSATTTASAGVVQQWKPWHDTSVCKLRLDKVYQPNEGQPIHVVVTNTGKVRLQYKIGITVVQNHKTINGGSILVDNANAGEQSERPSDKAFSGSIEGSIVKLAVTSCSKRS